jgi:hypothetical protein
MRSWIASLTWFFAGAITRTLPDDLIRRYEGEEELMFTGPGMLRDFVSILEERQEYTFSWRSGQPARRR